MEILDQLETRVEAMVAELNELRRSQTRQTEEAEARIGTLEDENRRLREELEQEKAAKQEVLGRIDRILSKITSESVD